MGRALDVVRRATRIAAFGVAVATVGLAASCRDVVTDEVVDAQAALCGSFEACDVERSACKRLDTFFGSQNDEVYAEYLAYYIEWDCGESCGAVDVCLDFALLCEPTGERCVDDFECCDASTGAAACKDGLCCYDLGVVCESPDDCCPFDDGTEVGCFTRLEGAPTTCGGVDACKLRDEACDNDDDCCGDKAECAGGTCQTDTCVERDAPCRGSEECCLDGDECRDGTCKLPDAECDEVEEQLAPPCCPALDTACTDAGPACCGGNICKKTIDGVGICRPPNDCGPPGTLCAVDEDCCSNGTDAIGCVAVNPDGTGTRVCGVIGCQLELDAPCGANGLNCCTGLSCLPTGDATDDPDGDGIATTTCQEPCAQTACHDIRAFGPPLDLSDLSCLDEEERGADQVACADTVCKADPFCCCYEWSLVCVNAALACLGLPETDPGE